MFSLGDLVVCTNDKQRQPCIHWGALVRGRVYTVAGLHENPLEGWLGVELAEIPTPTPYKFWAFNPDRFRPVSRKTSELFLSWVEPVKSKETA